MRQYGNVAGKASAEKKSAMASIDGHLGAFEGFSGLLMLDAVPLTDFGDFGDLDIRDAASPTTVPGLIVSAVGAWRFLFDSSGISPL